MQVTDQSEKATKSAASVEPSQLEGKGKFEPRKEIKSLTSLRFFACCVMVYYHAHGCFSWLPDLAKTFAFAHVLTFFFVLSGFILTYNYYGLSGARSTCLFYLARVARLWPCHVLSLTLLICLMPDLFRVKLATLPVFLSNLFMVHSWIPSWKVYFSYNAPSWTNSTEIFFYLCFPLLLWSLKRNWFAPVAATAAIGITLVLTCNFLGLPELDPVQVCTHALTVVHPLARLFEFTVGMAAALLFRKFLSQVQWSTAKTTLFEITAITILIWLNFNSLSWRADSIPWAGIAGANWLYFIATPVLAVACLMTILATEKGLLARILGLPLLVLLGELSFAIYMIHSVLVAYRQVNYPQEQSALSLMLFLAVIFLTAHFLWFAAERPFRRAILKAGTKLVPFKEKPISEPQIIRQMHAQLTDHKNSRKKVLLVFGEAIALALVFYLSLPALHRISSVEARTMAANSSVGDLDFAPYLRLKAAWAHQSNSKVSLRIVWETLQSQSVNFFATVTAYDHSGNLLGNMTYSLAPRLEHVQKGTLWYDDLVIQTAPWTKATAVEVRLSRSRKHALVATKKGNPTLMLTSITVPII